MKKKLNKNNDIKNKKKNLRLYLKLSFFFLIYLFFFLFFISFVISQEKINELNVEYLAKKVALDIDNYNISEKTMAELESDFVFRNLALQTDNLGMYTTIVDADNGFIYFHPQKTLEKKYSYLLKEKYFQAWLIINKTLKTCSDSYGYYDWLEEDGKVTKKYMYLTCTETKTKDNKRLIVASTAYLNSSVGIDYIFNYFHKNLVLVAQEYPPYISNLLLEKGFFTELTKEAFKRQNYNIDVKIMSWTEAYNGAKEGLYDGIIHVWYTKERENYFAYSDEMPPTEFVFCTLQKSNISDFKDLNSLKNFKIGSVKDYGYPEEFKKANLTKIESIFDYENIENLINGNVDLIIIDKAQFEYYKNNFYSNSSIFCLSPSFKTVPAHVIISKKLPNYLKIIYDFNEGLKKIKYDGTYDKILKKHNMTFYIKFDKKLKSASEKDYPPLAIVINDSGHLISDGFSVELLKEVLKSQGYEVDFYIDDWNNIKNDLKNQKIDLLPLVARTPEREAYFDFSVPYITLKGAVFTRDNSNIKSYENLKNKKIIVMKGDNAEEYVLRNKITDKLITTKTYEEAFLLLSKENSYDAIIVQEIVGNSIIKKLNLKNIKKAFVLEDFKQDFAFAVSKGNKDLLNILNEGLSKKIADGTYENLYKKWLIFEKKENEIYFDKTFFIKLFFIIFIILIITIIAYFISPKSFMPILFLLIAFLIIILLINTFNQTKRIEKIAIDLSKNELESLSRITEHHIEHVIEDYKRMIKSLTTQENLTKEELEKIKEADNYIEKLFVSDEDYKKENQSIIINNTKYIVIYSPYKERYLVAFVNIDLFKNIKPFFSIYKTSEILINEELNDFDYKNIKNDYKLKNSFEDEDYIYYYNYIREIDFSYLIKIEKKEILFNIKATNNLLWINTLLLIISIIFLSFIGNYFITRELKKEIKNKTKDLENLNKDLEKKVSERTKELQYLNLNLENEVKNRTKELEEKINELENTKKAILNILEDFDINNKELIKAKIKLNETIEKLKLMDKKKDEFLSVTAHELKTPLTSIKGFIELLKNPKVQKNKKLREKYFNIILQDTERLGKLITDILDLSRLDLGTMKFYYEKTTIEEIMNQVSNLVNLQIKKKGLKLYYEIKNKIPVFYTDKSRLIQVLANLINNSIKYTEKGYIKVEAFLEQENLEGEKKDYLHFRVIDTGLGIPKEAHKNIFQRFYQVDSSYTRKVGGTGLGLSICKGIVEALNGSIWFNSELGKGTTFEFKIKLLKKMPKNQEQNKKV